MRPAVFAPAQLVGQGQLCLPLPRAGFEVVGDDLKTIVDIEPSAVAGGRQLPAGPIETASDFGRLNFGRPCGRAGSRGLPADRSAARRLGRGDVVGAISHVAVEAGQLAEFISTRGGGLWDGACVVASARRRIGSMGLFAHLGDGRFKVGCWHWECPEFHRPRRRFPSIDAHHRGGQAIARGGSLGDRRIVIAHRLTITGPGPRKISAGQSPIAQPEERLGGRFGAAIADRRAFDRGNVFLVDRPADLQLAERTKLVDHHLPQGRVAVHRPLDGHVQRDEQLPIARIGGQPLHVGGGGRRDHLAGVAIRLAIQGRLEIGQQTKTLLVEFLNERMSAARCGARSRWGVGAWSRPADRGKLAHSGPAYRRGQR